MNLAEDATRVYEQSAAGLVCRHSPGSVLTGITTRFQIIDTDEQAFVAGVVFRPGGTVPFVAAPARELSDADVPLEALWGRQRTGLLREQLLGAPDPDATLDALEATLLDLCREKAAHPAVRFALAEFRAHPSMARIRAVTDAIGLSPKRFIERFKADVGVTPKRFCRLLRFQRVVKSAHDRGRTDWTELALACGYFDQAHLIHDFREFSGLTPTAYEARRTAFQNHVTFSTIHGCLTPGRMPPMPDTIETYRTLTPYLVVPDADAEMHFLTDAFGATEVSCQRNGDGTVMHAELKIGDSLVMLGQASAQWKALPAALYLWVPDVDAAYARALDAGARRSQRRRTSPTGTGMRVSWTATASRGGSRRR